MNESMNQLISIFSDIITQNGYITFAYSSLDDQWFFLSGKAHGTYDSLDPIEDLQYAYAKMLEECHYYWLEKNQLVNPDSTIENTVRNLSPEIREILDHFLEPYVKAAEKLLEK